MDMEHEEKFSQIENLEGGKERYEENLRSLEKAKDKFVEMGLFEKDFIDGLNFVFIDDIKKEGEKFNNYQLTPDGKIVPLELDEEKLISIKTACVYSNDLSGNFSERIDALFQDQEERHQSTILWIEGIDFNKFYSFDGVAVHEIAHTRSYAAITENNLLLFDREKFSSMIKEVLEGSEYSRKFKSIGFSKFDLSVFDWSELYAILYHREFLRRENKDNNKLIQDWDDQVMEIASDLKGSMKEFNRNKGTDIDPEIIYEDCHAFSFLLARFFEEKYKDFNERIKALESCKKQIQ